MREHFAPSDALRLGPTTPILLCFTWFFCKRARGRLCERNVYCMCVRKDKPARPNIPRHAHSSPRTQWVRNNFRCNTVCGFYSMTLILADAEDVFAVSYKIVSAKPKGALFCVPRSRFAVCFTANYIEFTNNRLRSISSSMAGISLEKAKPRWYFSNHLQTRLYGLRCCLRFYREGSWLL